MSKYIAPDGMVEIDGYPAFHSNVLQTSGGTYYLQNPGVVLTAQMCINLENIKDFISGFEDFGTEHAEDYIEESLGSELKDAELLVKFAGQLCYLSFGKNRTRAAEAHRYFENLKKSGHGSVFEHANYTFLFYGVDRAFTHEMVRHRAGFAYSQASQRYIDGRLLRFVEDFESQDDAELHAKFEAWIDAAREQYDHRAELLRRKYERQGRLEGMSKTDARKAVNQAARRCLPNETEAPIVVTGNVRAWRNFLDQRANAHADVGIRRPALLVGRILKKVAPMFFGDYELQQATGTLKTEYRKV